MWLLWKAACLQPASLKILGSMLSYRTVLFMELPACLGRWHPLWSQRHSPAVFSGCLSRDLVQGLVRPSREHAQWVFGIVTSVRQGGRLSLSLSRCFPKNCCLYFSFFSVSPHPLSTTEDSDDFVGDRQNLIYSSNLFYHLSLSFCCSITADVLILEGNLHCYQVLSHTMSLVLCQPRKKTQILWNSLIFLGFIAIRSN